MSEQFMYQQQVDAAGHDTEYTDPRPDRDEPDDDGCRCEFFVDRGHEIQDVTNCPLHGGPSDEEPRLKAIVVSEYELDDVVMALLYAVRAMPYGTPVQRARQQTVQSLADMLRGGPWVRKPEER